MHHFFTLILLSIQLCALTMVYGHKQQPCPCWEHKNELAPRSTYRRHIQEIARGERARWTGDDTQSDETQNDTQTDVTQEEAVNLNLPEKEVQSDAVNSTCLNFTHEITELVSQNLLTVTGAEAVLKIVHANYQEHLKEGYNIPTSWYKCKKLAMDGNEPVYFTRDFCSVCDYLYSVNSKRTYCPECSNKAPRYDIKGTHSMIILSAIISYFISHIYILINIVPAYYILYTPYHISYNTLYNYLNIKIVCLHTIFRTHYTLFRILISYKFVPYTE